MPEDLAGVDDAVLARRIAEAGARPDTAAEAELYRRLAPRARLYGLRHLRDPHAAHDLMQQVLMTTLERLRAGAVRDVAQVASFMLGMCRLVVLEIRRGTWRRDALLATYGDTPEAVDPAEQVALDPQRLAGCLDRLAERERSVIVLTFFGDQTGEEVGRALGLAAGNVRVIRHRALGKLRACMEGAAA
ncbi:MAG: sigma-70 family RNA polymerase sigma factor [Burkholderiales bacterium]